MRAITFATLVLLATSTLPAFAEDMPGTLHLPPICLANGPAAEAPDAMGAMGDMSKDQAHTDLMAGMGKMDADMNAGATATDIDVAFVCSMLPHHQGAIDMAKAELAHGDNEWAKTLAQGIIKAQQQEIADMLNWLSEQPK